MGSLYPEISTKATKHSKQQPFYKKLKYKKKTSHINKKYGNIRKLFVSLYLNIYNSLTFSFSFV